MTQVHSILEESINYVYESDITLMAAYYSSSIAWTKSVDSASRRRTGQFPAKHRSSCKLWACQTLSRKHC